MILSTNLVLLANILGSKDREAALILDKKIDYLTKYKSPNIYQTVIRLLKNMTAKFEIPFYDSILIDEIMDNCIKWDKESRMMDQSLLQGMFYQELSLIKIVEDLEKLSFLDLDTEDMKNKLREIIEGNLV